MACVSRPDGRYVICDCIFVFVRGLTLVSADGISQWTKSGRASPPLTPPPLHSTPGFACDHTPCTDHCGPFMGSVLE